MSCFWSHDWSKWEQYEQPKIMLYDWMLRYDPKAKPIHITERRQKRQCAVCKMVEDCLL